MAKTDALVLTNDAQGYAYQDRFAAFGFASESSAHGISTTLTEVFAVPAGFSGEILDVGLGVVLPGVSASGFISGQATATVRINSVAVCSTDPKIVQAGSAGQAYRVFTYGVSGIASGLVTSAVVNVASNALTQGDQVAVDMVAASGGSAAAGAAGKGLYGWIKYRYKAR